MRLVRVVPVLDLLGGEAVHAVRGERERYRRVDGRLGTGADPVALAAAMGEATGSDELYVADLDAIGGGTPQAAVVGALAGRVGLLLDAGVRSTGELVAAGGLGARTVVAGTETLPVGGVARLLGPGGAGPHPVSTDAPPDRASVTPRLALSLDLRAGALLSADPSSAGLPVAAALEALWDERVAEVVVLDLALVGAGEGPPLQAVREVAGLVPGVPVLAGGGVRDAEDLRRLADAGADGALVASALHAGALDASSVAAVGDGRSRR